jgi:3-phenylpropionate/trans-cinnamate dioxygenase ferredoxin reductase subunit
LDDGIVCSGGGETSIPGVYAAGDAARWDHPLLWKGKGRRTEHWTSAADQARTVTANILRDPNEPPVINDAVPYFWCDIFDTKIQVVGFIQAEHEVALVPGTEGRAMLFAKDGHLTGAATFSRPKVLAQSRRLVGERASLREALDALSQER